MPNIDISVDRGLAKLFIVPPCSELSIPGPSPLKVQLPTGGLYFGFLPIFRRASRPTAR